MFRAWLLETGAIQTLKVNITIDMVHTMILCPSPEQCLPA